jgi:hypothetical protein
MRISHDLEDPLSYTGSAQSFFRAGRTVCHYEDSMRKFLNQGVENAGSAGSM